MSAIRNPAARHILSKGASAVAAASTSTSLATARTVRARSIQSRTLETNKAGIASISSHQINGCQNVRQLTTASVIARNLATLADSARSDVHQSVVPRSAALETLSKYAAEGNTIGAYQTVLKMRQEGQLQTRGGDATVHVIQDTQATLALVEVIKKQHVWEECLDCLNLIVDVQQSALGKQYTDTKFVHVGMAANRSVDPEVLAAILQSILSPNFGSLPDRHLAGLTALQLISDYNIDAWSDNARAIRIRVAGYLSNRHALQQATQDLDTEALTQQEKCELAVAYARCMDPESALDILASLTDLPKESRIEAQVAISISLAECTKLDEAIGQLNDLYSNEDMWTEDQAKFDRQVTKHQTQLHILISCMRAVIPRLPLTQNFHTLASKQKSVRYTPGYTDRIVAQFSEVRTSMRKMLERETWKHTGLDKLLFTCECMLYSMSQTAGKHQELISISQLAKRLHSLEREFKRRALLHVASNNDRQAGLLRGAGTSTGPLRNFLWAVLFASKIPQQKKIDIIRGEIEHIQRLIPGVALSVADLEPALLAALPAALWRTARRGNFKDDSAFIPADEFICNFGRTSIHPYIERILDMAKAAELSQSSDHRLFPIRAWIAVLEGNLQRAMSVFKKSLEVAHLRVVPGSLAVANTRDHSFFEQMLCVASTFRRGADFATTHMRSAMRSQETSTPLTPRIATGLLYCCDTSRNFAVARDTIESLEALETHGISPKVSELYMRVCIACGEMAKALAIFDQLNYSSKHTQSGEPSFLHIIDYMGNSRLSAAGAEYAFATWLSIMDYQGRISPALMEQWQKAGLSRDARGKRNMFLPESGLSVDQALQSVGIERRKPGSLSDRQFLRDWEYTMVMSLVGAYISAGYTERALVWEQWILHAIGNKQIRLSPALLNRTAHVQLKHISRGDWEGMRMCLDYVIAIDSSLGIGIFRKDTYYLNQAPVFKSVALAMSRDAASSGQLAAQIKSYLAERDAAYILDKIYKLI